jgi:hypothetical protein
MPPRFLFGPATAEFADSQLRELRREGVCLAFGPAGADLTVGADASGEDIDAQFRGELRPDLVALWLNYTSVPACFLCTSSCSPAIIKAWSVRTPVI